MSFINATREDDDYYYFEGYNNYNHTSSILNYKIASRYILSKAKENIVLKIEFKNTVLEKVVDISFIKEGQIGSNGTAYATRIVRGGSSSSSSVPYGWLDKHRIARKLKLIFCIGGSNPSLYVYDYDTKTLIL